MTTPFVARDTQVAQLMGALERAATGRPGVVLLGADAGVGKTRLLHRAAALATRSGATVVTGHCVDLGEIGLPYLPFAEALGSCARRAATSWSASSRRVRHSDDSSPRPRPTAPPRWRTARTASGSSTGSARS